MLILHTGSAHINAVCTEASRSRTFLGTRLERSHPQIQHKVNHRQNTCPARCSAAQSKKKSRGKKPVARISEAARKASSTETLSDEEDGHAEEALQAKLERLRHENEALEELIRQAQAASGADKASPSQGQESLTSRIRESQAAVDELSTAVAESPAAPSAATPAATSNGSAVATPSPMGNGRRRQPQKEEAHPQTDNPMDIVFVSAEVAPWSKTGGLGDVVGSLPISLAKRGHRVMVVAPRYMNGVSDHLYDPAQLLDSRGSLDMGACGFQEVAYYHVHRECVDWVFVDHPCYHRQGNPYADANGAFGDNQFRYALLSMAACEAPLQLNIGGYRSGSPPGFPYGEKILFMANDWHAALVPAYLAGKYRRNNVYRDARSIIAIHNLSHQGVDPASTFANLGLPDDWYDPLSWSYPSWSHVTGPAVNILKGGVAVADRVVTVSQGYAWEITTAEGGWGLDGVLKDRQHVLNGIANGIDMAEWNPETDEHTPAPYSADSLSGKAECKAALQRELGLEVDPGRPLIGWIGRLDHQKGPDLVLEAVPELASRNCQVVMLGSGTAEYESAMREAEVRHNSHFRGWVGFSIPVAHRIIAACDIILMPSRFEPCGLNQLFAMRYGTIPIAHATGGLRDTIEDYNPFAAEGESIGTGWTFAPPDVPAMMAAVDLALTTYHDHRPSWEELMRNGMRQDLSWNRAAEQYEQIFTWAFTDPPVRAW